MVAKGAFQALLLLGALGVGQPLAGTELHGLHGALGREKRTLVFTEDGATGILVAVSVPLLITGRNIFMAYNFEANYGMPSEASDFTQGVLKKVDNDQIHAEEAEGAGAPGASQGESERRRAVRDRTSEANQTRAPARFTRKKLYRSIELNLARHGLDGKKCILRLICELASWPANEANGVVGDLLQLVFTPSSSQAEKLPNEFYRAEELGGQRNCLKYTKHCPRDPLEAISVFL